MSRSVRRLTRRVSPCPFALLALLLPIGALAAMPARDSTRAAPPIDVRLPADIVFGRMVSADSAVTFSHATHFGFAHDDCTVCHPRPFHMLQPTHHASHSVMNAGGSCGTCHDGKHAFGTRDSASCATCHAGRASRALAVRDSTGGHGVAAQARRFPSPHAYPSGESSPGRVTFRHETHLKRGESCASCHPKPFGMRFTPPRPDGGMHEASACGACHDGKQSFGTEDAAACNRCHVETGAHP